MKIFNFYYKKVKNYIGIDKCQSISEFISQVGHSFEKTKTFYY